MPSSGVYAVTSMRDYFRNTVDAALAHQALSADNATSAYLVDLLCEYGRGAEPDVLAHPLTWTLVAAETSTPTESFQRLKEVGDHSLYVAGYFGDSLPQLQLDLDYFVGLGSSAYRRLSRMLGAPGGKTQLVVAFAELGTRFVRFVSVLGEVKRLTD
jgi:hypothetical protein